VGDHLLQGRIHYSRVSDPWGNSYPGVNSPGDQLFRSKLARGPSSSWQRPKTITVLVFRGLILGAHHQCYGVLLLWWSEAVTETFKVWKARTDLSKNTFVPLSRDSLMSHTPPTQKRQQHPKHGARQLLRNKGDSPLSTGPLLCTDQDEHTHTHTNNSSRLNANLLILDALNKQII